MTGAAMTLYGIAHCDRCRAARRWLTAHDLEHGFHDLRADGLEADRLEDWIARIGLEALVNRRSTSWRALTENERQAMATADSAIALIHRQPTLLRRPLLETGDGRLIQGFTAELYEREFGATS